MKQPSVPERLLIASDLVAFIEIDGYAHTPQREVALRTPRRTRLSITGRQDAEYALNIGGSGFLAALKLLGAFEITERAQILGGSGMQAVPIRMETNGVLRQGPNDICSLAGFKYARLLADEFE